VLEETAKINVALNAKRGWSTGNLPQSLRWNMLFKSYIPLRAVRQAGQGSPVLHVALVFNSYSPLRCKPLISPASFDPTRILSRAKTNRSCSF
jgi:hypothetical protein